MDELIGKYLAGEASPMEIAQVEKWESLSDANKKYVLQFKLIFNKAAAVKEVHQFDSDAAWNKMKVKLRQQHEAKTIPISREKKNENATFTWVWRVAASVALVIGVGYYFFSQNNDLTLEPVEVVAETKAVEDNLPDGSNVVLNKKTKLHYAYNKKNNEHIVKLKGEAFFQIKHDDKRKFVIEAEGVFIRDIGTSFNVKAYPNSDKIEVFVKEGAVEFFTEKDSGVFLRAGGKGVFNKKTKEFSIDQPETNVLAYKTKFFSFSDQDLGSAIADLNNVYEKQIVLNDKLRSCRLTVTFNNEDIEEIARVLADTYDLTIKETANEIILDGAGCEK